MKATRDTLWNSRGSWTSRGAPIRNRLSRASMADLLLALRPCSACTGAGTETGWIGRPSVETDRPPFHLPTELADGLGHGSDLVPRLPAALRPIPGTTGEIGSSVPPLQGRDDLGCFKDDIRFPARFKDGTPGGFRRTLEPESALF